MDPDPLRRLRDLRDSTAAQLVARLTAADAALPELRELQERLRLLDATLADQRTRDERRWGALLWPVGLVAAALLVAASVPVPSVPLSLELRASSATLDLPAAAVLGAQPINGELRIDGFTSVESADAALADTAARERAERLSVRSGQAWLRSLSLPADTRLTVQARADSTTLLVESARSPVIADVELRGATVLRLGDADAPLQRQFDHSEWLRLIGGVVAQADRAAPPMTLSIPLSTPLSIPLPASPSISQPVSPTVSLSAAPSVAPSPRLEAAAPLRIDALRIDTLRPSSLRFAERRESLATSTAVGATSSVSSSLEGGTLSLPASGKSVAINGGDWLEVDGLVVDRFELSAGMPLLLKLSGSARTLRLRVGEFERSLKPSWLEYFSQHHLVTLLWGSMVLGWGALAWIRKHFSGAHA
ncbi:MAG: hypothetical protein H7242_18315 [Microbacteriaceae bacterium]|nr:hypothetical protein [Burkholderiaceae bacterium]